jgi:hypothetical protein
MRANSDAGILGTCRLVATTLRGLGDLSSGMMGSAMAGSWMMGVSTFWSRTGVLAGIAITRGVRGAGCSDDACCADDEGVLGAGAGASARATCGLGLKRASAASRALFTCSRSSGGQSVVKCFLRKSFYRNVSIEILAHSVTGGFSCVSTRLFLAAARTATRPASPVPLS